MLYPERYQVVIKELPSRQEYKAWLPEIRPLITPAGAADSHGSSPLTWRQEGGAADSVLQYVGGHDDTMRMFKAELGAPPASRSGASMRPANPDIVGSFFKLLFMTCFYAYFYSIFYSARAAA